MNANSFLRHVLNWQHFKRKTFSKHKRSDFDVFALLFTCSRYISNLSIYLEKKNPTYKEHNMLNYPFRKMARRRSKSRNREKKPLRTYVEKVNNMERLHGCVQMKSVTIKNRTYPETTNN